MTMDQTDRDAMPELVEDGLSRMLGSPLFTKSPRQRDLLRYLVNQTMAGNAARLKGYVIGVEVFGRGADFDPAVDAIVRVEVARLRARLSEYYAGAGQTDTLHIALPKGGYAVEFRRRDTVAPPAAISAHRRTHLLDDKPSLAALPLVNLCPDPGLDYFVDGITDNLIYGLARLSGLFVISRQSSFAYRGAEKSSETIGKELGVRYLLEGSVQRSGQRVRVTVQLIEAATGWHIWSDRYESDVQDIFALQDDVTRSIVQVLQVKLAPAEAEFFGHEGTNSVVAHDALLRGLECHWKYAPKAIAEARQHFSRAVEDDPHYAAAHAWLARSIIHQWIMKWSDESDLRERAMLHAQQALQLSPRLPYAHAILGWAHLWCKQREPALASSRHAVALDPNNPESLNMLSMCLSSAGYGEEALFYIEKALKLNPHSSPFYEFVLGQAHFVLEDYDKAIAAYQRGCTLSSSFVPNHVYLCTTYALLGMDEEMRAKRDDFLALLGGDKSRLIEPPWLDDKLAAAYEHLLQLAGLREKNVLSG